MVDVGEALLERFGPRLTVDLGEPADERRGGAEAGSEPSPS
jgi:hypothetical protein